MNSAEQTDDEYASMNPILVTVKLNGVATEMEVDTGASMSIISTSTGSNT